MNLKPYPKYKDSGIKWLGEIPEEWEVRKLGYHAEMTVPMRDKPPVFDGDIPWIRIEDFDGKYIYDSKSDQRVSKKIIRSMNLKVYPVGTVLCSCSCNMGATAIVSSPLISNQTFIGIVPRSNISSEFLYYLMNASSERLQYLGSGAIQQYLSKENFKNLKLALPPLQDQTAIANFLDQKITRIDELIKKNEKLSELLKEKRQAVISHAVTKGLDPDARMKDSGIGWIGEIPENWEVKKLKWIARLEYGSSLSEEARADGTVPVYGSNGIVGEHSKSITDNPAIIIGRKGSYGKVSYSDVPCFPIDTTYYIDQRLTKENIRWLYYLLISIDLDQITFDTGVPGLSRDFAYDKLIPLPTKNEQTAITNFLDHKTAQIDESIKKILSQIETLKEYRQALISNVVTGKLRVN